MKIIVSILFLGLILACSDSKRTPSTLTEKKWYEGGTLHQANIYEWKNASEENKLATCADFMAFVDKTVTMDILLERAIELRACVNEATRGVESVDTYKVSEMAALCIVTLGYKN